MIRYFDASALTKRYVREPGSQQVHELLDDGVAATARYTEIEILSALARRRREGQVEASDHARIAAKMREDMEALVLVELGAEVVDEASRLLDRHPLRAGDALQIASCIVLQRRAELPVSFVAFDQRCNDAARAEALRIDSM